MGACAVDIEKGHRNLSVRYALNDRDGVHAILRDIHHLRSSRFERGDYAACDVLIDLAEAIERAGLTDREREALHYVYERDMTAREAARIMGINEPRAGTLIANGINRIVSVFSVWNYGEVTIEEAA
ncbi:sigma factor-like helix-turn-helix DNA-binding protein [Brevibacillus laterosporus]|uniref:sigma factor-like helix-turn-helix DNA-binding protein n=1 Tax=Bacillales TaxID=1385 RepID=UPI000F8C748B|nr:MULTISPECIES: sigma factor-like helix-turn-helix DNA-binding protein [Bacillales]MCR8938777.1 RNA polymerase subunit sigma [Brevibacillus laterosporus]MCZ0841417.1 sigma factor-like helix-turn-helix DNA-binding protein [Brevibacillus laterosporus]MCZ0847691.1 sigma factor-like helix-turn-helix DNA-binding protein [Brevibacillus laterosporus]RUR59893.1 RNA polymerase subunit sigma [Bacillus sp. VKPM B-3276]